MSSEDVDHETLFRRNYELYEIAKQRGEAKDVSRFALLALAQIHHLSGVSAADDRSANVSVMHRLLVPGLGTANEADTRERYNQLRKDAGIG